MKQRTKKPKPRVGSKTRRTKSTRPSSKRRVNAPKEKKRVVTTISKPKANVIGSSGECMTLPFDGIHEPGTYVCKWSGHLLRVPQDGFTTERTPRISVIGANPLLVTKLDDDPFIPVNRARLLAAEQDVAVNF